MKSNFWLNIFKKVLISLSVRITVSAKEDVFLTLFSFSFSNKYNFSFNSFNLFSDSLLSVSDFDICSVNFLFCSSFSLNSFSNDDNLLFNSFNSLLSWFSACSFLVFSSCSFNSVDFLVNSDISEFKLFISFWSLLLFSFNWFIFSVILL